MSAYDFGSNQFYYITEFFKRSLFLDREELALLLTRIGIIIAILVTFLAISIGIDSAASPVAKINITNPYCVGCNVTFDASESYDPDGNIVSYDWHFGDQNLYPLICSDIKFNYTFFEYSPLVSIYLDVIDNEGNTNQALNFFSVCNWHDPQPIFSISNNNPLIGESVIFNGSASIDYNSSNFLGHDSIIDYEWDFGDGNVGNGEVCTHTYFQGGIFTATLKLTDDEGRWALRQSNITVISNSKIAFSSDRDNDDEIYIMNTDGSCQTQLTFNNWSDIHPCWSPDGTKIAFVSDRDGDNEIYVMNTDGSNQTRLTNTSGDEWDPCWSPDGTKIAFMINTSIMKMNADGSDRTELVPESMNYDPSWSPDGTKIVFSSEHYQPTELWIMNADGSDRSRLTIHDDMFLLDTCPSWSPLGTKIAFVSNEIEMSNYYNIFTINPDGFGRTKLTNTSENEWDPCWSFDGTKIAFVSDRDGNNEIYVMNADGSDQTRLTNNPSNDDFPSFSPRIIPSSDVIPLDKCSFGLVEQGAKPTIMFGVMTGLDEWIISDIQIDSNIVTARSSYPIVVPPLGTADIPLEIDTESLSGFYEDTVRLTFFSNRPTETMDLKIGGEVIPDYGNGEGPLKITHYSLTPQIINNEKYYDISITVENDGPGYIWIPAATKNGEPNIIFSGIKKQKEPEIAVTYSAFHESLITFREWYDSPDVQASLYLISLMTITEPTTSLEGIGTLFEITAPMIIPVDPDIKGLILDMYIEQFGTEVEQKQNVYAYWYLNCLEPMNALRSIPPPHSSHLYYNGVYGTNADIIANDIETRNIRITGYWTHGYWPPEYGNHENSYSQYKTLYDLPKEEAGFALPPKTAIKITIPCGPQNCGLTIPPVCQPIEELINFDEFKIGIVEYQYLATTANYPDYDDPAEIADYVVVGFPNTYYNTAPLTATLSLIYNGNWWGNPVGRIGFKGTTFYYYSFYSEYNEFKDKNKIFWGLFSPVNMTLTDDNGGIINRDTVSIPGGAYLETDIDKNGEIEKYLSVPYTEDTTYKLYLTPDGNAQGDFTLIMYTDNNEIPIEVDTPIEDISSYPYSIHVEQNESGVLQSDVETPYDNLLIFPGWNFISIPRYLSNDNNTAAIFSVIDMAGRPILSYENTNGQWNLVDSATILEPLEAYWVYSVDFTEIPMNYLNEPATPPVKHLTPGWNTIGLGYMYSIETTKALRSISEGYVISPFEPAHRKIWNVLLEYDNGLQMYLPPQVNGINTWDMQPGKGYWIYIKEPGDLVAMTG